MSLRKLKFSAKESAQFYGHKLGSWEDFVALNETISSNNTCTKCGAWVQVETKPAPNSIDIGGPVVAVSCN